MDRNTIYYKFFCEKKKYSINFDTTEISIGDIKREISRRRNMEKAPEEFELLFYDENNAEIKDDNYKVKPLKTLVIKRIPKYKLQNFIEIVTDPTDIPLTKGNEYYFSKNRITFLNASEPLEKISPKLSLEMLQEKFKCVVCKKKEENGYVYDPVIMLCCHETICKTCANEPKCPLCSRTQPDDNRKDEDIRYVPNNAEMELKVRLYEIFNKMKEGALKQVQNSEANNSLISNGTSVPLTRPNISIMPKNHQSNIGNSNQAMSMNIMSNPSYPLFETARFFIIKSSNKENIEISQKHSEWATTLTNQKKLNEAFQKNNVILIFSASRTGCFQGYAIMTSYIGDKVSNLWQNENNVKLGGSFSVYWLCICEMQFMKVKNMVNKINQEPVTKSRDTQELDRDSGFELCNSCFEQEKTEANNNSKPQRLITSDTINSINNDIKTSRENQLQMQNSARNAMSMGMPMGNMGMSQMRPPNMMNPGMFQSFYNPSYMYGFYPMPMNGGMGNPAMMNEAQLQMQRDRSRSKSKSKSNKN